MKCFIEGCERTAHSRGLCVNCYQLARNQVIAKKMTWEQLEKMGLAACLVHGDGAKSKFQQALSKKLETIENEAPSAQ